MMSSSDHIVSVPLVPRRDRFCHAFQLSQILLALYGSILEARPVELRDGCIASPRAVSSSQLNRRNSIALGWWMVRGMLNPPAANFQSRARITSDNYRVQK
jgi:hypothetical protein